MEYKRNLTKEDIAILSHDLLDITDWINKAIESKINNCKKRAAIQYREILKQEGTEMIPTSDDTASKLLFARKDYLNRIERELYNKGT